MPKKNTRNSRSGTTTRPLAEWVVGALSAIVAAVVVAFLLYQAAFGDARPPDLAVAIEGVDRAGNGTTVRIAVTNSGDEAAAGVAVQASLNNAQGDAVQRDLTFDYVAGHAVRRGAFVLPGNAAPDDLTVEITGYVEP